MTQEQQAHETGSVNRHYLDKVMELAEERNVEATEDIYDTRGMKLVAKGTRISNDLQERLIVRKLRKPLESSIAVENGVGITNLVKEAKQLAESIEPVGRMLKNANANGGPTVFDILNAAHIGGAMSMMLTITERGGTTALAHSVIVSLVSICLARKFGLGVKDQTTAAIAGVLHDIGELYVNPEYLSSKRRLLPHEWSHVVVHPRIGQMLIAELENYPPAVGIAVAEHHERLDGSGYPRQLTGTGISAVGQAVSVAEMIAGVFMRKDRPLDRAELALKIIPGEHPYRAVSAVSEVLRAARKSGQPEPDFQADDSHAHVCALFARIASVHEEAGRIAALPELKSRGARQLMEQVLLRIKSIERAFSSTGLYICMEQGANLLEEKCLEMLFEATVATNEIQWRLRDVARNIALLSSGFEAQEVELFQPLIALLDDHH